MKLTLPRDNENLILAYFDQEQELEKMISDNVSKKLSEIEVKAKIPPKIEASRNVFVKHLESNIYDLEDEEIKADF